MNHQPSVRSPESILISNWQPELPLEIVKYLPPSSLSQTFQYIQICTRLWPNQYIQDTHFYALLWCKLVSKPSCLALLFYLFKFSTSQQNCIFCAGLHSLLLLLGLDLCPFIASPTANYSDWALQLVQSITEYKSVLYFAIIIRLSFVRLQRSVMMINWSFSSLFF